MLAAVGSVVAGAIESVADVLAPLSEKENDFLVGNFAPVAGDARVSTLKVEGTLPKEMDGMYARIGPNPGMKPNGGYHVFDGDGMVHIVKLDPASNTASYARHQIATSKLEQERKNGKPMFPNIGAMRGLGGLARMLAFELRVRSGKIQPGSTANTALVHHGGKLLALSEADAPYVLELSENGVVRTGGHLLKKELTPFTAHPKVDPETGLLHAFGYKLMGKVGLNYYVMSPTGELLHNLHVPLPKPIMMHDFAITKNYVLFLDFNVVFKPERIVRGSMPFFFDKKKPSRIGIMRKMETDPSNIIWVDVSTQAVFHVLNAFERDDHIIEMCASRMENFSLDLDGLIGAEIADVDRNKLYYYTIDIIKKTCLEQLVLDDKPYILDFPVIAPHLQGRPHRYGFVASFVTGTALVVRGIYKVDLSKRGGPANACNAGFIEYGEGRGGGEAFFVPKLGPDSRGEDDGFLVAFIWDSKTKSSELCVWDAYNMSNTPVATLKMPYRVPYGFHGLWISTSGLPSQQLARSKL